MICRKNIGARFEIRLPFPLPTTNRVLAMHFRERFRLKKLTHLLTYKALLESGFTISGKAMSILVSSGISGSLTRLSWLESYMTIVRSTSKNRGTRSNIPRRKKP